MPQEQEQLDQIKNSIKIILSNIFDLNDKVDDQDEKNKDIKYELDKKNNSTKDVIETVSKKIDNIISTTTLNTETNEIQNESLENIKNVINNTEEKQQKELKLIKLETKKNGKSLKEIKNILSEFSSDSDGNKNNELGLIGGLLSSLLGTGIGGLTNAITSAIGGIAANALKLAPLLAKVALPTMAVMATAAGGYMVGKAIFENWIEPWMDENQKSQMEGLSKPLIKPGSIDSTVMTNEKGESMYLVDNKGEYDWMTESELKEKIKTTTDETEKTELQKSLTAGPAKRQTNKETGFGEGAYSKYVSGETTEQYRLRLRGQEQFKQLDPEQAAISKHSESIAKFDELVRFRVKERIDVKGPNVNEFNEGLAKNFGTDAVQKYKGIMADKDLSDMAKEELINLSPLIKQIKYGYPYDSPDMWSWSGQVLHPLGDWGTVEAMDKTRNPDLEKIKQEIRDREKTNTKSNTQPTNNPSNNIETEPKPNSINSVEPPTNNSPKAQSEAIIEGSKDGTTVTLGENYTPEAIISTKPNNITKDIASNISKEISTPDIESTKRMSLMLQDGLSQSKTEYFDMTKAQPLASQTNSGTNIINNVIGNTGNSSEPNTQYNPAMLNMSQPETLAQQCLYDSNKAALL